MNEHDRIKDAFLDMLSQACGEWDAEAAVMRYDSMCLSAYENALDLAVELRWIEKGQVLR